MNHYDTDYATNTFWANLRKRVSPLIGDPEASLGHFWMDRVEDCFSRNDFNAYYSAVKLSGSLPDWYVVRIWDAGLVIAGDVDYAAAAPSFVDAVAFVASSCTDAGIWPTGFTFDENDSALELTLNEEPFITIEKLQPHTVSTDKIARIQSTLYGLQKSANPIGELVKRMKKWPGMNDALSGMSSRTESNFHFPDTSEWLISAKKLAMAAGVESSTKHSQELAAAIFGEPSWNHLCGHFKHCQTHSISAFAAPYLIAGLKHDSGPDCKFFPDLFSAFVEFLGDAKHGFLDKQLPLYFVPELSLQRAPSIVAGSIPEVYDNPYITLLQMHVVPEDVIWVKRTQGELTGDMEGGLRRIFNINLDASSKLKFRNAENELTHLVTDGPWSFSLDEKEYRKPFSEQARLWAICQDQNGNVLMSASVRLDKGQINYFPEEDLYVLSGDYHGKSPVALIPRLSKDTVNLLSGVLSNDRFYEFGREFYSGRDRADFARLLSNRTEFGSTK